MICLSVWHLSINLFYLRTEFVLTYVDFPVLPLGIEHEFCHFIVKTFQSSCNFLAGWEIRVLLQCLQLCKDMVLLGVFLKPVYVGVPNPPYFRVGPSDLWWLDSGTVIS